MEIISEQLSHAHEKAHMQLLGLIKFWTNSNNWEYLTNTNITVEWIWLIIYDVSNHNDAFHGAKSTVFYQNTIVDNF